MSDILNGWKDIAAYLRVSEATARRYAKHDGLPVRKLAGRRVIALKNAVCAWALPPTRREPHEGGE